MSRTNFESMIEADFLATAHIALDTLSDVIRNALLQGIMPDTMREDTHHPPDNDNPNGWTETNIVSLRPPEITAQALRGRAVPIPATIKVKDENGNLVPLIDPDYPVDRQEQDVLLLFQLPFTINSNNQQLAGLNVDTINGTFDLLTRPYFSPTTGIGFIRFDFIITVTQTLPQDFDALYFFLGSQLRDILYPQIINVIALASFTFPKVSGLSVNAARIFPNLDTDFPATLSLGLGGNGTANDLLPLLDPHDGLTVTVSKTLFEQQITTFNKDLPKETVNWDDKRKETITFITMQLRNEKIHLQTEIRVKPFGIFDPDASIAVKGLITFSLANDGINSHLVPNGDGLDVDIDVDWWADLLRAFADIFTLGFAELYFTPEFQNAERQARGSVIDEIGSSLQGALLGSFPSGEELFGRDVFMSRESTVMWATPDYINIKPKGLVLGGPAIGGIKHTPRRLQISQVYRKNNSLRSYAFGDEFHLTKKRTIDLYRSGKIRIPGVSLVKGATGYYLRDKADKNSTDNLSEQPFFNPSKTNLPDANAYEPLKKETKYGCDDNDKLITYD